MNVYRIVLGATGYPSEDISVIAPDPYAGIQDAIGVYESAHGEIKGASGFVVACFEIQPPGGSPR